LHEVLGREPTDEELADELGIESSRVSQMRVAAIRPTSLDSPLGDDAAHTVGDLVHDENAETPYEKLESEASIAALRGLLEKLSPREASILRARFNLDGGSEKTLDEVGQQFQVTRERVRQIQNKALEKLRIMLLQLNATRIRN
jgi:RNA polymerase primary sigma factor